MAVRVPIIGCFVFEILVLDLPPFTFSTTFSKLSCIIWLRSGIGDTNEADYPYILAGLTSIYLDPVTVMLRML